MEHEGLRGGMDIRFAKVQVVVNAAGQFVGIVRYHDERLPGSVHISFDHAARQPAATGVEPMEGFVQHD